MEYKLGDPERGKTLFEGIVDSHPKRWDMWSIYMDMEVGQGDIMNLRYALFHYAVCSLSHFLCDRNLFGRVLALKLTSHKAK